MVAPVSDTAAQRESDPSQSPAAALDESGNDTSAGGVVSAWLLAASLQPDPIDRHLSSQTRPAWTPFVLPVAGGMDRLGRGAVDYRPSGPLDRLRGSPTPELASQQDSLYFLLFWS